MSEIPSYDDAGNMVVDANGNPVYEMVPQYQNMDYAKPTPILWAALNRALDRLDAAEAEIATLKAKAAG